MRGEMHMPVKTSKLNMTNKDDAADALEGWAGDIAESIGTWSKTWEDGMADLADRIDAVETRGQRVPTDKADAQRNAFEAYVRGGKESLTDQHRNSLIVSDDTKGGYLTAPKEVEAGILRNLTELSPIRRYASVRTISSPGVSIARQIAEPEAYWVGETEQRTGTTASYGREDIPVHTAATFIDVSLELLEDSAYDIIGEITQGFGRAFAKLESVAHMTGDGHKKPLGLLNTPGLQVVKTGTAASITADSLLDLAYDLPAAYADNGTYLANRKTLGSIRKLKSGDGAYLWQDSLQAGQPPAFNMRPMVEDPSMPNVGAGLRPVVFGDLRWFRIYDRIGLSIMRDDVTLAGSGEVRFWGRRRTGAGLVLPEAVRVLSVEV